MIRSAASSSISSCSTSRTASRTRSVTSTERVQLLGQGRLWQGHRRATPVNIVCGYHSRGGSCTYRRSEAPTHCSSLVAVLRRGPVQRSDRRSFECGRCCLGRMRYVRSRRRSTFLRRRSRTTLPRSTASSGYPRDGASKTSLKQTPVRSLTSGCQGAGDFPRHSSAERIASLALLVTEGKASETALTRTTCFRRPGPHHDRFEIGVVVRGPGPEGRASHCAAHDHAPKGVYLGRWRPPCSPRCLLGHTAEYLRVWGAHGLCIELTRSVPAYVLSAALVLAALGVPAPACSPRRWLNCTGASPTYKRALAAALRGHRVVLERHAVPSYSARLIGCAALVAARRRGRPPTG